MCPWGDGGDVSMRGMCPWKDGGDVSMRGWRGCVHGRMEGMCPWKDGGDVSMGGCAHPCGEGGPSHVEGGQ